MARITRLTIEGYRSIGSPVAITFPRNQPVVLVGEHNTGTSNIWRRPESISSTKTGASMSDSVTDRAGRAKERAEA